MLCLSHFSHVWLFATPRTVAHQAPLSMQFSRQEYYSGLPCPPPGDLPHLGTEPMSPTLGGGFFTIQPSGKPSVGGGSAKNSPFSWDGFWWSQAQFVALLPLILCWVCSPRALTTSVQPLYGQPLPSTRIWEKATPFSELFCLFSFPVPPANKVKQVNQATFHPCYVTGSQAVITFLFRLEQLYGDIHMPYKALFKRHILLVSCAVTNTFNCCHNHL